MLLLRSKIYMLLWRRSEVRYANSFVVANSFILAWFLASTRPRWFEGTGRQGSDLLTPGQKPAKLLKHINPYLENRLSVACVQSFFRVN